MNNTPLISIIIPYYRGKSFISASLQSVLDQTIPDWEIICIDDGSPDDGFASVEAFARRDRRIKMVRQPNRGVSNARNRGAAAADPASRYLLFLDQDDLLEPNALGVMTHYLDENPGVGAAFFAFSAIDGAGKVSCQATAPFRTLPRPLGWRELPPAVRENPLVTLMAYHHAVPSTTIFRRSVFAQTRGWDESFRHAFEDQDMIWQVALLAPVHYVPIPITRKRDHPCNTSKQSLRTGYRQLAAKWWRAEHASPAQRNAIRDAMTAEALLTGYLNLNDARLSLKRGLLGRSAAKAYFGLRKLALFAVRATLHRGLRTP